MSKTGNIIATAMFCLVVSCVAAFAQEANTPNPASGAIAALEQSVVDDLADGRLDSHSLADAVLIASGVNSEEALALYRTRLEMTIRTVTKRVPHGGGPERRARRLLAELHRDVFKRYEPATDRFAALLDQGVYNCVSSTLLYILAARELGLDVSGAETPLHVFVVLKTPTRRVSIETTSPAGYDARHDLVRFRSFVLANKYATAEELAERGIENVFNDFHRMTQPIPAERVVALLYHNAGIRALQRREAINAAGLLVNAARIYPNLAYRSENLRTTLAWAVREQYDGGDYLGSFRLGEVAMRLFPGRTTVTDRFIAVTGRLVEETAGAGRLAQAEEYEARALGQLPEEEDKLKLEALTAPVIARSALLSRDWESARRHAARFRTAYPDPLEAERFAGWVEARAAEGSGPEGSGSPEFFNEMRGAVMALPAVCTTQQLESVVEAVGALATQGRFEEALAVGRMQRDGLRDEPAREAMDVLLKAVARRQITTLLTLRRWRDAGQAAEEALSEWPGDADLQALHGRIVSAARPDLQLTPTTGSSLGIQER
ncbi:MAG: hypothetical protein ACREAA_16485 [Candidatus Polarisedimenticolia bacterium]